MSDNKTPGVYVDEKNAFPNSVVAVPTAVPVFIGYTEKAVQNGKDLTYIPTKITSMSAYAEIFGGAYKAKFIVRTEPSAPVDVAEERLNINGQNIYLKYKTNNELYFYNALRLFYLNGGGESYILSVGSYNHAVENGITTNDFFSTDDNKHVFKILEKELEPTLIVLPDVAANKPSEENLGAYEFYLQALEHCNFTQNRMGIFDVARSADGSSDDAIDLFRSKVNSDGLKYGAAYYPWLKTTVVSDAEVDFNNLDDSITTLKNIIPNTDSAAIQLVNEMTDTTKSSQQIHESLLVLSSTYNQLIAAIKEKLNLLPPSSAMAGVYTTVDNNRGVWKAPANVSLSGVIAPEVNITSQQQELFNVDAVSGKSINCIRSFIGQGTLVWGARTLDGNSNDWRYINVRRTMIYIEQSLKLAISSFVFEPNDANTWTTIQSMANGFLYNLWKQGGLAGSTPEDAYKVDIGLGSTMTPDDIIANQLKVSVKLSLVRPSEFIVIVFQQQLQNS
jgi:hypothetical protein